MPAQHMKAPEQAREDTSPAEPSTAKQPNKNSGAQPYTERSATETEKQQKTHRQKQQTGTPRAQ